jgi:hypothetical protein
LSVNFWTLAVNPSFDSLYSPANRFAIVATSTFAWSIETPRLELADDLEERTLSAFRRERVRLLRNPDLVVVRERESFRHDADDRVRNAIHANVLADDVRVAAVSLAPRGVGEDRHLLADGLSSPARKFRPSIGRTPTMSNVFAGDPRSIEPFGLFLAADIDRSGRDSREIAEAVLLGLVVEVVLDRERRLPRDPARRIRALDDHDAVAVRVGQAFHQRAIHDAEHRRRETDAEGQRQRCDEGQPRAFEEAANSVSDVAKYSVHDRVSALGWGEPRGVRCAGQAGFRTLEQPRPGVWAIGA